MTWWLHSMSHPPGQWSRGVIKWHSAWWCAVGWGSTMCKKQFWWHIWLCVHQSGWHTSPQLQSQLCFPPCNPHSKHCQFGQPSEWSILVGFNCVQSGVQPCGRVACNCKNTSKVVVDELGGASGDGEEGGESDILMGWDRVPLPVFCLVAHKLFMAPMALCTPGRRFLGNDWGETTAGVLFLLGFHLQVGWGFDGPRTGVGVLC